MDPTVRNYLIRAHKKIIAHYHRVLAANSLSEPECNRIKRGLASIEAELSTIEAGGSYGTSQMAQEPGLSAQRPSRFEMYV